MIYCMKILSLLNQHESLGVGFNMNLRLIFKGDRCGVLRQVLNITRGCFFPQSIFTNGTAIMQIYMRFVRSNFQAYTPDLLLYFLIVGMVIKRSYIMI